MAIKKKGLILYASVTGNTEKVAKAFGKAFENCGWSYDLVKITAKTSFKKDPVYFDDYDFVCLGSPIMAGLPSPVIGRVLGLTQPEPPRMWRSQAGPGMDMQAPAPDDVKGVVFATYAGAIREAYSTLAVEKQYLECLRLKIVGEFSCPGCEISHMAVDRVSAIMGVQVENAAPLVQLYKQNPNAPEFKKLDAAGHEEMRKAVADPRDMPDYDGMEGFVAPKYDLENRPNQRDLTMAEYFMQNLIQDYFMGRTTPQETYGEYMCIG